MYLWKCILWLVTKYTPPQWIQAPPPIKWGVGGGVAVALYDLQRHEDNFSWVLTKILKISQWKWQSVLVFHNSSAIFSKSNLKEKSRQFQYFSWNLLILEQSPTHWLPTHWGWEKTIQNSQQQSNTTFCRFSNYRSADTDTKTNTDSLLSLMYKVLKFDFVNNIYMLPNTC